MVSCSENVVYCTYVMRDIKREMVGASAIFLDDPGKCVFVFFFSLPFIRYNATCITLRESKFRFANVTSTFRQVH